MTDQLAEPSQLLPSENEVETSASRLVLYVDGRRVPCDDARVEYRDDGVGVRVVFETTRNCLAAGDGNPLIERAWAGKASGELWYVRAPHPNPDKRYPRAGCVVIKDIVIPDKEGEPVVFRCHAQTPVFDYTREDNDPIAEPGDEIELPNEWLSEKA